MPEWLKEAIGQYGLPAVIAAYYMYKDWRFTERLVEALAVIKDHLTKEDRAA